MSASRIPSQSTPFPNDLLDIVMPVLSDTEWRVLCVVVRATLGWEGLEGKRKEADWLTQRQLKARTGRASAAISRAIEGLMRKGLITVCGEEGEQLDTPAARRRFRGKLLFSLTEQAIGGREGADTSDSSLCKQSSSETEVRKANITKETVYKNIPVGMHTEKTFPTDRSTDQSARSIAGYEPKTPTPSSTEVRRFLAAYQEMFARHSLQGERPPISWGRDGRLVKGLLIQYGYERLLELLEGFFQSEDVWVQKRGYALWCFPTLLPQLLMGTQGGKRSRRSAPATSVAQQEPSGGHWSKASEETTSASLFERYPDLARQVRGQPP